MSRTTHELREPCSRLASTSRLHDYADIAPGQASTCILFTYVSYLIRVHTYIYNLFNTTILEGKSKLLHPINSSFPWLPKAHHLPASREVGLLILPRVAQRLGGLQHHGTAARAHGLRGAPGAVQGLRGLPAQEPVVHHGRQALDEVPSRRELLLDASSASFFRPKTGLFRGFCTVFTGFSWFFMVFHRFSRAFVVEIACSACCFQASEVAIRLFGGAGDLLLQEYLGGGRGYYRDIIDSLPCTIL